MKILITSGGTTEKIDSVRGITNHATGTLGKYIAETFLEKGYQVTLVTTKEAVKPKDHPLLTVQLITNVDSLLSTLEPLVKTHDVFIHSMAVSDYTPVYMTDLNEVEQAEHVSDLLNRQNTESKISSKEDYQVLFMKKTPKVIYLVKTWNPDICLIGFKLLVNVSKDELFAVARESLQKNKARYILANDLTEIKGDKHHAYLLDESHVYEADTKKAIANLIFERVTNHD
nr:phosphopantothenate--cysteine ligase [Streptococcus lutetiensis]